MKPDGARVYWRLESRSSPGNLCSRAIKHNKAVVRVHFKSVENTGGGVQNLFLHAVNGPVRRAENSGGPLGSRWPRGERPGAATLRCTHDHDPSPWAPPGKPLAPWP